MPEDLLANHGLCAMDLDFKKTKKLINTQTDRLGNIENFHSHIINNTDVIFSNYELLLLNAGLKYNLNHQHKNWIRTLALKTETAVNQLPTFEQEHVSYQVAHDIKPLFKKHENNKT
jgi:hypothetical protein